jgi:hypothetical protein
MGHANVSKTKKRTTRRKDSLLEPLVAHDKVPLLTRRLDLAPHQTARCRVDGHARDDRGVRHGRFVDIHTLQFGQAEGDVECVLRSGAVGC